MCVCDWGVPKYSKPLRWDPVDMFCGFIWCFFEMQIFPFSFASVHRLILEEVMGESVNNLAAFFI